MKNFDASSWTTKYIVSVVIISTIVNTYRTIGFVRWMRPLEVGTERDGRERTVTVTI
jgi:hypothetical protein